MVGEVPGLLVVLRVPELRVPETAPELRRRLDLATLFSMHFVVNARLLLAVLGVGAERKLPDCHRSNGDPGPLRSKTVGRLWMAVLEVECG